MVHLACIGGGGEIRIQNSGRKAGNKEIAIENELSCPIQGGECLEMSATVSFVRAVLIYCDLRC